MIDRSSVSEVFKSLSDSTRLRMTRLLAVNNTEMCVCEFVDILQERQYNVSKQLKILQASGLIRGKKDGRWIYYGLVNGDDPVAVVLCQLITSIPDTEEQFAQDQHRYLERMSLREEGRCRVGIQSTELVT